MLKLLSKKLKESHLTDMKTFKESLACLNEIAEKCVVIDIGRVVDDMIKAGIKLNGDEEVGNLPEGWTLAFIDSVSVLENRVQEELLNRFGVHWPEMRF